MSDIMIECPIFRKAVPTGITTNEIILQTLTFKFSMQCPACRKIHKWSRENAWIGQSDRLGIPLATKRSNIGLR